MSLIESETPKARYQDAKVELLITNSATDRYGIPIHGPDRRAASGTVAPWDLRDLGQDTQALGPLGSL
jgi:hypothetical protein